MFSKGLSLTVIIPAGGSGDRFGGYIPKQYSIIAGKTILEHTVNIFLNNAFVKRVIIAKSLHDTYYDKYIGFNERIVVAKAGITRFNSVLNCLTKIRNTDAQEWVLVHDAVRCCLHSDDLNNLISTTAKDPVGGILAEKSINTLKKVNSNNQILATIDRNYIVSALTPQMFRFGLLNKALNICMQENISPTDESQAIELLGLCPRVVYAKYPNPKLTYLKDLTLFESLLTKEIEEYN
jgi:2-C-methyl-D-erythritol 4-phosphate cytidylyltransferase